MKNGDLVIIVEDAYARSIVDGKLIKECFIRGSVRGLKYRVIETGCSFPLIVVDERSTQEEIYRNDTIIQGVEGEVAGKVVLIHHRFLRLVSPDHTIVIDGKTIEVSHESFLNLKKQLT